ncbi:hypothetical protein B0189_03380 [Moraxella cuniculi]|nr:hypothetical protein B0189_03380 [Moraxella cuniculi]
MLWPTFVFVVLWHGCGVNFLKIINFLQIYLARLAGCDKLNRKILTMISQALFHTAQSIDLSMIAFGQVA